MNIPEKEKMAESGVNMPTDRRKFCANCFSCVTGMMLLAHPGVLSGTMAFAQIQDEIKPKLKKKEIRKLFMQKGSCAHLSFYLLNLEYGHNKNDEERAIDQLAGGLAQRGYQCGMLWGTSMGASAEAYRRNKNKDQAIASSVSTTKQVVDAFVAITGSPDCVDIINIDFSKRFSKLKMIFSAAGNCFDLAYRWHPAAIKTTEKWVTESTTFQDNLTTCASEVIRKMGGSEEEMVMVSGFAGGLGLSGNACGAVSAAIWMKTLDWCRKNPEEKGYAYGGVEDILALFNEETNGEMLCYNITGKRFNSIDDHAEFIKKGGCRKIIELLAET